MIHSLSLIINKLDSKGCVQLAEFGFFLAVGITAGSLGLIQYQGVRMTKDELTEKKLAQRAHALQILLVKFQDVRSVYECADDWCKKETTNSGLVSYYKAYYAAKTYYYDKEHKTDTYE